MTALLLTAVGSASRKASVALAADHLVAVVGLGQGLQGRFNDTTTKTEDQMKSGLLLNVVVRESAAIFELLSGENETLLIRRNSFLVLNLLLDVVYYASMILAGSVRSAQKMAEFPRQSNNQRKEK